MALKAVRKGWDLTVTLRWVALAVSLVWIVPMSITEFAGTSTGDYGLRDAEVREALSRCDGSFQARFDCKQRIILQKDRASFAIMMKKLSIVLGPPILLAVLLHLLSKQIERKTVQPRPNLYKTRRERLEASTRREEIDFGDL